MMSLVWELTLPDSEKLVLLALADCADDEGVCWPSIATLARKCTKSERTVQCCIRSLEQRGHLGRKEIAGKGCRYLVHPIVMFGTPAVPAPRRDCTPAEDSPVQPLHQPPQRLHPTPAAAAPKPSKNHQEPSDLSSSDDSPADAEPSLRPEHVFEFYRELAAELGRPVPIHFTPERRALTKARIAQYSLEEFQTVFAKCRDSPFLRGDTGRTPLTFDWLMKKGNFQKVLEGNYDR